MNNLTNQELCNTFAFFASKGQKLTNKRVYNSNKTMFIEGDTIYSYGTHFPIASFDDKGVWVTRDKYSKTTSKQTGMVKRALAAHGVHFA